MASRTLTLGTTFPDGTTVGAYPASAWADAYPVGAPKGTLANEQEVVDGQVTFNGLTGNRDYYVVGDVGGTYRYIGFTVATRLAESGGGGAIPDAEGWHFVGETGEPPFENGQANFSVDEGVSALSPLRFFKNQLGTVFIAGVSEGSSGVVFTLPDGYQPAYGEYFNPLDSAPAVSPDGSVSTQVTGPNTFGINFRAGD